MPKTLDRRELLLRATARRFHIRRYSWVCAAVSAPYTDLGRWQEAVEAVHKALRVGEEFAGGIAMSFAV